MWGVPVNFLTLVLGGALAGFLACLLLFLVIIFPLAQRKRSKELLELKDQFVGLASHYLLTPLSIIQFALTRLLETDGNIDMQQRLKLYDSILLGEQRLQMAVEQISMVGEIDQGTFVLRPNITDVPQMVSAAIQMVDVIARHKGVQMHYTDENYQGVREVRIDARRMKQAIMAVIDNAIKFSVENAEIFIRLSLKDDIVTLEVEDHGIGMPEKVVDHASDKFYRGSDLYNYDYEGLGLGLHIAQSIVRLHGGNISFSSRQKQGTIASIQFPSQ